MDHSTVIEMIGYFSSLLVVVSMLMSSVIKLRVINSIGSGIFAVYALIIHSYPTAMMNICLVAINIYNLVRLSKKRTELRPHRRRERRPFIKLYFKLLPQ